MATTLGVLNPFRYRSYVYDEETSLYYLRSRYYNPDWGRFINADSVLGKPGKLLGHNVFAYCRNNPVNQNDPSGKMGYSNNMINLYIRNQAGIEDKEEELLDQDNLRETFWNTMYTFGVPTREAEKIHQAVNEIYEQSSSKPGKVLINSGLALYHLGKGTFDFAAGLALYSAPEPFLTKTAGSLFMTRGVYHYTGYLKNFNRVINTLLEGE